MDQVSQVVLALLRSALWDEENTYPADTDWQAVTKELHVQAVMGVIAGSDVSDSVPAEIRTQWEKLAMLQGAHFYKLLHEQNQMLALLEKNDIHPVILKGTAAAVYYPDPEMRTMGDVDFLVPREQVEKAYAVMLADGYEQYLEKDTSNKHISLQKAGIHFELHRYFGIFDSMDKMEYMDGLLKKGLQNIEWTSCAESRFPMLPPLANGLVLLEHAAGHFRGGLGLRHITDWMLYAHTCLTDAFWEEAFRPAAQALGLDVFAQVLTKMCQRYLGLPASMHWCQAADDSYCDQLMKFVLEQGNFGKKEMEEVGDRVTRLFDAHNGISEWLHLLQLSGLNHWQAVKRHAFLKPFAWVYGIGRYAHLALGRKKGVALVAEEKKKSNQRNELCEGLGLKWSKTQVILQDGQFKLQKR